MRRLAVLIVLCIGAPASGQDNDAEKLYRATEKKVHAGKSLQVVFDAEMVGQGGKLTFKGTVSFGLGNKARMDLAANFGRNTEKILFIADGMQGYLKEGDKGKVDPNPKKVQQLDKILPGLLARLGLATMFMIARSDFNNQNDFDLDKDTAIKNFKLGAKEMVGKRNTQVVDYQVEFQGETSKVSLWIDTQTQLPLKRVLTAEKMGQTFQITETYTTFQVDTKLDPKLFEIPAK